MNDIDWKICLQTCSRVLGPGNWDPFLSKSWYAFTTFSSLGHIANYFNCGFPTETDCLDNETADGGIWRQAFQYADLAHLIIPRNFYWEHFIDGDFQNGYKNQDINLLSSELAKQGIAHTITKLVLEIKLY